MVIDIVKKGNIITNVMKTKTLIRSNFSKTIHPQSHEVASRYRDLKSNLSQKMGKPSFQTGFLYVLSILSITCWIISLKILPFGDLFQFLLGAVVLSVNFLVFKFTKI
jgi:uncharacterized membrane protein